MRKILDAYRQGDMSDRAGLFLTYRHLRDEFMAIETAEEAGENYDTEHQSCYACRICSAIVNRLSALLF